MLEIEFPTKRISRIINASKTEKTAATGSLYIERPSYNEALLFQTTVSCDGYK